MEFANLNNTMRMANDENKRFVPLFGSDTFRSWIIYFHPGEHTDMHYHLSPETFLVLQGKASVKGLKGEERTIEKTKSFFSLPRIITRSLMWGLNRWCSWATGPKHSAAPT